VSLSSSELAQDPAKLIMTMSMPAYGFYQCVETSCLLHNYIETENSCPKVNRKNIDG
jgi:hypothetical protein